MSAAILVWLRRDLRLDDNPAFAWALAQRAPLCPLYIYDPDAEAPWAPGSASRWWLHHSLHALAGDLAQRGLRLMSLRGPALELIPALAAQAGAGAVVCNSIHEPRLDDRDRRLGALLQSTGRRLQLLPGGALLPPGQILTGQGQTYRVFTPFWRNARRHLELAPPQVQPWTGAAPDGWGEMPAAGPASLGLLDTHPWWHKLAAHWQPGEAGAWVRVRRFLDQAAGNYQQGRDRPDWDGTSRLAPHLHFGEISPRRVWTLLQPLLAGDQRAAAGASAEAFLRQLGWREFARELLLAYPHTDWQCLDGRYGEDFWQEDPDALAAWQRGETGVPLVDAGQRELWSTGWMHNRVRMLAASWLTKNLGIHWRHGARWFWDTLVDADLANNSLGWQWVAGCGADAAPYYRIFNPDLQAARFDPQGSYRRRWLGDIRGLGPSLNPARSRDAALRRHARLMGTGPGTGPVNGELF